jgi:thymidylate synthase (FAD)
VANYTELYWKIDLKNLLHYIALRNDSHAQHEIEVYAKAMFDLIAPHVPITIEAFNDYWSPEHARRFSRQEMLLLKSMVDMSRLEKNHESFGLSKREMSEFVEKLIK